MNGQALCLHGWRRLWWLWLRWCLLCWGWTTRRAPHHRRTTRRSHPRWTTTSPAGWWSHHAHRRSHHWGSPEHGHHARPLTGVHTRPLSLPFGVPPIVDRPPIAPFGGPHRIRIHRWVHHWLGLPHRAPGCPWRQVEEVCRRGGL